MAVLAALPVSDVMEVGTDGHVLTTARDAILIASALQETSLIAYPNPFRESTTVEFTSGSTGWATLRLIDHLGRQVSVLYEGNMEQGILHKVILDKDELPSGIYLCTLHTDDAVLTRTLILSR
jgi:hypothetical protein